MRYVSFSLRDKLEQKFNEFVDFDVIERVEGSTFQILFVVIVFKLNGDIRFCVDMRQVNSVIVRERYFILIVDEVFYDLNGSIVFSKFDIKWVFY